MNVRSVSVQLHLRAFVERSAALRMLSIARGIITIYRRHPPHQLRRHICTRKVIIKDIRSNNNIFISTYNEQYELD